MLDLSKFSKRWISRLNCYLLRVDDEDMIIYALISKNCKKKRVIKTINKHKYIKNDQNCT